MQTATPKTPKKATTTPETIAEVKLVPIELIDAEKQFRQEFDKDSIGELAKDIQERGLLQPVLLNPNNDRFQLIAGERRLHAVKLNGSLHIPALITKVSADEFELLQLAENIQREELTHEEEAKAVQILYKKYGSLAEVSKKVNKSISWVSKRYTSGKSMTWMAKELLEEGITEDFELIKGLEQYYELAGYDAARKLQEEIKQGKAGRNEVRALVKELKTKKKEQDEKALAKAKKVSHAKPKQEKPWIEWRLFVKHAITHEAILWESVSSKNDVTFQYEIEELRNVGLDGEVWKGEEKIREFSWNEPETKEE